MIQKESHRERREANFRSSERGKTTFEEDRLNSPADSFTVTICTQQINWIPLVAPELTQNRLIRRVISCRTLHLRVPHGCCFCGAHCCGLSCASYVCLRPLILATTHAAEINRGDLQQNQCAARWNLKERSDIVHYRKSKPIAFCF